MLKNFSKKQLRSEKWKQILNKLTLKQRIFLNEFLKHGNMSKAGRATLPNAAPSWQVRYGSYTFHTPKIQEAIAFLLEEKGLTKERFLAALEEEVFDKPAKTAAERNLRLRGIEIGLRLHGAFKEVEEKERLPVKILFGKEDKERFEKERSERDNSSQISKTDTFIS